ncbi:MAG: type II toxin-antitoxin system YoeB family toxin [Candidatus Sulfopaludibacter sp.]|nr:type II toxin-antitoxin system YoeB family toxin [Candidatus Sulfopaludibacter sp.]
MRATPVLDLVEAVMRDAFQGLGKPEPLRYVLAGCWSRRVSLTEAESPRCSEPAVSSSDGLTDRHWATRQPTGALRA